MYRVALLFALISGAYAQSPKKLEFEVASVKPAPPSTPTLYQGGMHPHWPAVPWVPGIADFPDIPMGVVLPSCIIKRETTKARTISCCFRHLLRVSSVRKVRRAVKNGSAAYSNTTAAPHELGQTGMRRVHLRGRENILKRLVVHSGAANLGLLMRKLFGKGTPRGLQDRLGGLFSRRSEPPVLRCWSGNSIHGCRQWR